jgi:hypothetical protein
VSETARKGSKARALLGELHIDLLTRHALSYMPKEVWCLVHSPDRDQQDHLPRPVSGAFSLQTQSRRSQHDMWQAH